MNIEGKPYPIAPVLSGKGKCETKNALITCEKLLYDGYFWDRLRIVCTAQFSFGGINSSYINRSIISQNLYDYGSVCFFFDDELNVLLCLPCKVLLVGICGLPTRVSVFSPYIKGYERILDARMGHKFHVCYDTETKLSPKVFFIPLIEELAELSVTMRVNSLGLRAPIIAISSVAQKLGVENILQQYLDGKYIIELKDNGSTKRDGTPEESLDKNIKILNLSPPYNLDKLNTQRDTVWNNIMETLGFKVNTAPFKKERAITGEVEGNYEETISFYAARRNPRMDAVEWLKENGCPQAKLIEVTKEEDIGIASITEELEGGESNATI